LKKSRKTKKTTKKKAKKTVKKAVKKKATTKKKAVKKVKKAVKKKVVKKKVVKKVKKAVKKKVAEPKPKPVPRMPSKIIDEVVAAVAGPDVVALVKVLRNKPNLSEFKLADTIKIEINLTRNMLYRLYDNNLVSFIRKKDKKKGWYIYYWTFNHRRVKDLIKDLKKTRIIKLEERVGREKSTQFYMCSNTCMRLDFEQSHDFQFKCPECGELLNIEDNTQKILELEQSIKTLKEELATFN